MIDHETKQQVVDLHRLQDDGCPHDGPRVVDLHHLLAVVREVHAVHADDLCWMENCGAAEVSENDSIA